MQILIDIPEKEFKAEIEDKFQDFFKRLEVETKEHMINGTNLLCGAYELETIQMFMQALAKSTPLPKGHGRLIDADELYGDFIDGTEGYDCQTWNRSEIGDVIEYAPTIIEKDGD